MNEMGERFDDGGESNVEEPLIQRETSDTIPRSNSPIRERPELTNSFKADFRLLFKSSFPLVRP